MFFPKPLTDSAGIFFDSIMSPNPYRDPQLSNPPMSAGQSSPFRLPRRQRRKERLSRIACCGRRATAVVELAIVLPLLVLLLLGTMETCSVIYRQQTLQIAAYEGCRVALVPRITRAQVDAAINSILTSRRVRNATITIDPTSFTTAAPRTLITVRVDAPAAGNTIVSPQYFTGRALSGFCTMMKEF